MADGWHWAKLALASWTSWSSSFLVRSYNVVPQGLFRLSPLQLKKYLQCKQVSVRRLPSAGCRPQAAVRRLPSAGCRPQAAVRRLPSAGCRPQAAVRRLPSAGCRPQAAVRRLPSAGCRPQAAVRRLPSAGCRRQAAVRRLPSAGCRPQAAVRRLPSAGCRPQAAVRRLPSAGCCGSASPSRGLCLSVLQLIANVNGECKCWSLHVRPVASFTYLLSNCKNNLQCIEVAVTVYRTKAMASLGLFFDRKKTSTSDASVITCTTCGPSVCLLWNSKEYLQCKQVVVTACTTHVLFLSILHLKANVNSDCKCRHCMYDPWPPPLLVHENTAPYSDVKTAAIFFE